MQAPVSRWTYIRAIIDISGFKANADNQQEIRGIKDNLDALFKDKITGDEGNADAYYHFEPHPVSTEYNHRTKTSRNLLCHCSVVLIGAMRDRKLDGTTEELKAIFARIAMDNLQNKSRLYVEDWNSAGAIWDGDGNRMTGVGRGIVKDIDKKRLQELYTEETEDGRKLVK